MPCRRFYTPRPGRLFSEGDIYTLDFATDDAAYDDYLELLGRNADRVSNYHTNVYADGRRPDMEEDGEESLEDLCNALPELSDLEVKKLSARMEEGFYPEESVEKYEAKSAQPGERAARRGTALCRSGNRQRKNRISSLNADTERDGEAVSGAEGDRQRREWTTGRPRTR